MSLSIRIVPGDLPNLDTLAVDGLLLPFYSASKQPRGPAGLVDWRLSGRLARLLSSGRFRGKTGEAVLMSSLARVPAERLFLIGLGWPELGADPLELKRQLSLLLKIAEDAQLREPAIAPPEPFVPANAKASERGTLPSWLDSVSAWLSDPSLRSTSLTRLVLLDAGGVLDAARGTLKKLAVGSGATLE